MGGRNRNASGQTQGRWWSRWASIRQPLRLSSLSMSPCPMGGRHRNARGHTQGRWWSHWASIRWNSSVWQRSSPSTTNPSRARCNTHRKCLTAHPIWRVAIVRWPHLRWSPTYSSNMGLRSMAFLDVRHRWVRFDNDWHRRRLAGQVEAQGVHFLRAALADTLQGEREKRGRLFAASKGRVCHLRVLVLGILDVLQARHVLDVVRECVQSRLPRTWERRRNTRLLHDPGFCLHRRGCDCLGQAPLSLF